MKRSPSRKGSPGRKKSPMKRGSPGRRKSPMKRGSPGRRKSPVKRGSPGRRKSPVKRGSPGRKGRMGMWEPDEEKEKPINGLVLSGHKRRVGYIAYATYEKNLYSVDPDFGDIFKWNLLTGNKIKFPHYDNISGIAVTRDGKILVIDVTDSIIQLDTNNGTILRRLQNFCHNGSLALSDEKILFSRCSEGLKIWDMQTGQLLRLVDQPYFQNNLKLTLSDNNNFLFAGPSQNHSSLSRIISMWNTDCEKIRDFNVGTSITSYCVSPDGETLCVGTYNGLIRVFDTTNGNLLKEDIHINQTITSITCDNNNVFCSSGLDVYHYHLWNDEYKEGFVQSFNFRSQPKEILLDYDTLFVCTGREVVVLDISERNKREIRRVASELDRIVPGKIPKDLMGLVADYSTESFPPLDNEENYDEYQAIIDPTYGIEDGQYRRIN
jgi:hypothetical protein